MSPRPNKPKQRTQKYTVQYGTGNEYNVRKESTQEAVFSSLSKSETIAKSQELNGFTPVDGFSETYIKQTGIKQNEWISDPPVRPERHSTNDDPISIPIYQPIPKSQLYSHQTTEVNSLGRSYYLFALETALTSVRQARMLVEGDIADENHELPRIETLLEEAIDAS